MRAVLRAAIVGVGLALSACSISPPAAAGEPAETIEPVPNPISRVLLVYPRGEWLGAEVELAYILLFMTDGRMELFTGHEYTNSAGLQEVITYLRVSGVPVNKVYLAGVEQGVI